MDRGVFFLGATVVVAGIGYFIGQSLDENAGISKVLGVWKSRTAAGTAAGAITGASIAASYLYLEFLGRTIVWYGKSFVDRPLITGIATLVFLVTLGVLLSAQDGKKRPPKGSKV